MTRCRRTSKQNKGARQECVKSLITLRYLLSDEILLISAALSWIALTRPSELESSELSGMLEEGNVVMASMRVF